MRNRTLITSTLIGALALSPLVGCESLPGDEKSQGAVIGGLAGAGAGALIGGEDNRLIGALLGGALGAGGGYLIGAQVDKTRDEKNRDKNREDAIKASQRAEKEPARVEDVDRARTADLNDDGFVTLDEVVAMRKANLSDREMIDRLERTGQIFELTEFQKDYLRTRGVSDTVIREMVNMNQDFAQTASDAARDADRDDRHDPISRDRDDLGEERF